MSSRRGGKSVGGGSNSSSKGKNVSEMSSVTAEQLSQGIADVNRNSSQDDGEWEVISRKSKKGGSSIANPRRSQSSAPKAWGNTEGGQMQGGRINVASGRAPANVWASQPVDSYRPTGRGNVRPPSCMTSQPVIGPPLQHGWNWQSRTGAVPMSSEDSHGKDGEISREENVVDNEDGEDDNDDDDDDDDAIDDTDDELLLSEDFDSDTSQQSHETRKKSRWFKKFFDGLDGLSVEEINEPARLWHCPACQGGPGAIDWYSGLQPLMTHAKTKGAQRVKLHRELAVLLDEELRQRGASVVPAGEVFGKWKGLQEEEKHHEIVWPPMVIIMNTRLDKDENDKWIGMGNQELLDYFGAYAAVKSRHSYSPQGHRGISVLIFESSATGYFEAERLHKHFAEQGTDRNAWERRRVLFHPGGKRQLYGYMATKEDLDIFNQHSQGKSKLRFEMRSYFEMVVQQIRQMNEDNQLLVWFKDRVAKEKRHSKALEESFGIVSEKLRKTMEENRIVKQRTLMHNEQKKEEMDFQEQFFKDQLNIIYAERDAKEEGFEKLQQQKRDKVKQLNKNPVDTEEYRCRAEEITKFIQFQTREMEDFVAERDMLIKSHEEKMAAMKLRHFEEEVQLEKEFDTQLDCLMDKFTQH